MAASDYTGDEKASLDNIKAMINEGRSLQYIRNAMGLGDTLSVLPVANGGTGCTSVDGIVNLLKLDDWYYPRVKRLATATYSGSRVFSGSDRPSETVADVTKIVLSNYNDGLYKATFDERSQKLTIGLTGLYLIYVDISVKAKTNISWVNGTEGSPSYIISGGFSISDSSGLKGSNNAGISVYAEKCPTGKGLADTHRKYYANEVNVKSGTVYSLDFWNGISTSYILSRYGSPAGTVEFTAQLHAEYLG